MIIFGYGDDDLATALLILSTAFTVYVIVGYPALLAIVARFRSRPVSKRFQNRTVSVILPVRNGEAWIENKLESILSLNYPTELLDVFVVSNGSTDSTEEIVRQFASRGVRLISLANADKAEAVNAGVAAAQSEILFFTDVRQRLSADSLHHLVACFDDPSVGVVSGELVIVEGETLEEASVGAYWKYEKKIRLCLSSIDSILGATGCIYAMRRELAVAMPRQTLLDDMFLPLAAFFRGYRVILEPAAKAFDVPTSLKSEFRRKVRTLAGVYQIIGSYPALLGPRNRMWIHFMSHKFGRLLLPYALIATAVSSFWVPGVWGWLLVAAQAVFYLLALLDYRVPDTSKVKRLTSPIRTFLVLVAASLCAAAILFVPANTLWKDTHARRQNLPSAT